MKVRLRTSTVIVAMAAAFLMVFVVPAGLAVAGSADLTPGPSYTLWAYGAVRVVDFFGNSFDSYTYQGSATYGYSVILNQTNLTTQTFELAVNRTMGVSLSVEYCAPNCRHPGATATVSHDAWESVDDWANFTTNGTVTENGQTVSAIALLNTHSTLTGSLVDSANSPLRTSYLSANVSASAAVNFTTPLGLLPDDLTAASSWNSSSAFTASGAYGVNYHYHFVGPHGTITVGPDAAMGAVARSGTVSVSGNVNTAPGAGVDFGGVPYQNISISVQGPFDAREGFILVPASVDLFGTSASTPWSSNETGGASAQLTSLYVHPGAGTRLGIGGSEWLYSSSALNPSTTALVPSGLDVPEIASGADNVGSTPVQGVPIPVDQAQTYDGCLVSDTSCPSAAAGKTLVPLLSAAVIAVVVLVVASTVLIAERRRMPPPSYPNANLYPPGATAPAKPLDTARSSATRRPPPEEDDPLSNLW